MIQILLDGLKLVKVEDITDANILILKGVHRMPKSLKDVKRVYKINKQAKAIGYECGENN